MTDHGQGGESGAGRSGAADGQPVGPPSPGSLESALDYLVAHRGVAVLEDVTLLQSSLADLVPETGLRRAAVNAVRSGVVPALRELPRLPGGFVSATDLEQVSARLGPEQSNAVAVQALARALGLRTAVPSTVESRPVAPPSRDEILAGTASGDISPETPEPSRTGPPRRRLFLLVGAPVAAAVIAAAATGFVLRGGGSSTAQQASLPTVTASVPSPAAPAPSAPRVAPAPTPSPKPAPTPAPTAAKRTGSFAAEVKVLRTHVPAEFRSVCTSRKSSEPVLNEGLIARVGCELKGGDTPDLVRYYRYEDAASMKKAFTHWEDETKGSSCSTSRGKATYTITKADGRRSGGTLACMRVKGKLRFAWTHDRLHVVAVATDKDLSWPKMKSWWVKTSGPYD